MHMHSLDANRIFFQYILITRRKRTHACKYTCLHVHTQVNNPFLDSMEELITFLPRKAGPRADILTAFLVRGPIKKPERALQKLVRLYNRNPACLTDLVRCTVVVADLDDAMAFLSLLEHRSVVGIGDVCSEYSDEKSEPKMMRITQLKNRCECLSCVQSVCVCLAWICARQQALCRKLLMP
jgi:hypothetical protein